MRLSEKKKSEPYTAIHEPIMRKRISIQNSRQVLGDKNADDLDSSLFKLNQDIWNEVKKTLSINE